MNAVGAARVPMPVKRLGVLFALLVFAVLIVMAAYANVGLARDGRIPAGMLGYGLGLGGLVAIAYLAIARYAPWADPLLLPLVTLLNGLGLVLIWRLDLVENEKIRQGLLPAKAGIASAGNQLAWTALGIALFTAIVIGLRDHRVLQRYTYTIGAAGLVLLAIPAMLPASVSMAQGAKLWIRIGGFSIQPAEFAKLALVIFFAGYLVAKRDVLSLAGRRLLVIDLPRARDLGPVLLAWVASLLVLIFERDLGTSLLFFGIFVAMLYMATQRTSWFLIGLGLFVGGAFVAAQIFSHVRARVETWLNPEPFIDKVGGSGQLMEGLFSLASGGILGSGLGQGRPDLVPLAASDFIIAVAGEELGLTGLMAILVLYLIIVMRGMRTALASRELFPKLLAAGLSFALALQVFVVVGGVTKLIPLTGLTTPFMSQGGSSLLANWILVALLVRLSDSSRRPPPQPIQDEGVTQVVRTA